MTRFNKVFWTVLLVTLVALGSVGCSSAEEAPPQPAEEKASSESKSDSNTTEQADSSDQADNSVEESAEESEPTADDSQVEAEPTEPAKATSVTGKTLTNLNVRKGPGTNYGVIETLNENSDFMVIGRLEDGTWLQIQTSSDKAWITANDQFVEVDQAAVAQLPVIDPPTAPPVSYDASNPEIHKMLNEIPMVVHHNQRYTCASHAGLSNLLSEVASGNVVGPHAGDFVYQNGKGVLFKYTGNGFQLIMENPIARFDGDAEFLPFDEAMNLVANGEIVWTGHLGQAPGRGVPGCDLLVP
ncbi:SH3 domain-containing protein [Anaerolineales bacterium HSG6]|nr:SH3 domain-containing protein [Anaerolineales bacterium HSG6]